MSLNVGFTKNDLKTGDTVLNSKGSLGVVLKGTPEGDLNGYLTDRVMKLINIDLLY